MDGKSPETKTDDGLSTKDREYTAMMMRGESAWWKRLLNVQAPYRWNIRRLQPGFTLDIGCGVGRNLAHLGGNGVGIDHNPHSVEIARSRGLRVFTPDDFQACSFHAPDQFDAILLS